MSVAPIITFKAGKCDTDFSVSPPRIKPNPEPGFLYLYSEDDLYHFCWRSRAATLANAELDLMMVPTDASFKPYLGADNKDVKKSPVKGRVFVLKFSSSSARHFFWLQSREQPPGQSDQFSHRDLKLGQIVHDLLQGEEVDTETELAGLRTAGGAGGGDDGDTDMQDAPSGQDGPEQGAGGRGEGASGPDGGRAAMNAAVQNFLNSMQGGNMGGGQQREKLFTTLAELLPSSSTIPMVETAEPQVIEDLLVNHLPPALVLLEHQVDDIPDNDPDPETIRASVQALDLEQQRDIVKRVLRSPQFSQGLMSLTSALRDGGLPSVAEALGVELTNGGYTGPDRSTSLTGGDAVEAFLEGMKKSVEKK